MSAANFIINRIKSNLFNPFKRSNWICIITGKPSTGKTWTGMSLAECINPNFLWIKHGNLEIMPFLKFLENAKYEIPKGTIFLLDDFGTQMASREWQSKSNILYSKIFQIMGFLNAGLIITVPSLDMIDKDARKLMHNLIVTQKNGIDENTSETMVKIYDVEYNDMNKKIYYKYPQLIDDGGRVHVYKSFRFPKPSERNIAAYLLAEQEMKKKLLLESTQELESISKAKHEKMHGKTHKHSWFYKSKTQEYRCKTCGEITKVNPFNK